MAIKINLPSIPSVNAVSLTDSFLANYGDNNQSRLITAANLIALMNANNLIFCPDDGNNYRLVVVLQDGYPAIQAELVT